MANLDDGSVNDFGRQEEEDAFHRELGRFVAAFSRLELIIEGVVETFMPCPVPSGVAILLNGDRGPEAHRSWVSLRELLKSSTSDAATLNSVRELNKTILDLIEKRNSLVHGAWFFYRPEAEINDVVAGMLVRRRPGGHHDASDWSVEELTALAVQVNEAAYTILDVCADVLESAARP